MYTFGLFRSPCPITLPRVTVYMIDVSRTVLLQYTVNSNINIQTILSTGKAWVRVSMSVCLWFVNDKNTFWALDVIDVRSSELITKTDVEKE